MYKVAASAAQLAKLHFASSLFTWLRLPATRAQQKLLTAYLFTVLV